MNHLFRRLALPALIAFAWAHPALGGDDVSLPAEYSKQIEGSSAIEPLAKDIFGEEVGLSTGSLSFVQTDVELPGNNSLRVMVGRRFTPNQPTLTTYGNFADWDLEVPHLHGVFAGIGWVVPTYEGQRCSHFAFPPNAPSMQNDAMFSAKEYWQGHWFYMPGVGDQEMLYRNYSIPSPPTGTYPVNAKDGTMFSCIPLDTGVAGQEGFEALMPDGTRIRFDHMVSRTYSRLLKDSPGQSLTPQVLMAAHPPLTAGQSPRNSLSATCFSAEKSGSSPR